MESSGLQWILALVSLTMPPSLYGYNKSAKADTKNGWVDIESRAKDIIYQWFSTKDTIQQ